MSLQAKLEALVASMGGKDGVAMDDAISRLVSAEERTRPLKVGDAAPTFTLTALGGASVSSQDLLRSGPLVVTFYRGLWCPYCQHDLRGFADVMERIDQLGVSVVAVSQARASEDETSSAHGPSLGFPVLEDEDGHVAVEFGIRWSQEEARAIEAALGYGLVTFRGTEPWIVPMQARFVIDQGGKVAFSETAFHYEERSDPADLIPLLSDLPRGP
jgi:peroxiredoxin